MSLEDSLVVVLGSPASQGRRFSIQVLACSAKVGGAWAGREDGGAKAFRLDPSGKRLMYSNVPAAISPSICRMSFLSSARSVGVSDLPVHSRQRTPFHLKSRKSRPRSERMDAMRYPCLPVASSQLWTAGHLKKMRPRGFR